MRFSDNGKDAFENDKEKMCRPRQDNLGYLPAPRIKYTHSQPSKFYSEKKNLIMDIKKSLLGLAVAE